MNLATDFVRISIMASVWKEWACLVPEYSPRINIAYPEWVT